VLLIYASALDLQIPRENIIITLVLLLVPVAIGMGLRKLNANVGAVTEFMGSAARAVLHRCSSRSWVPRNWQFLMTTPATYFGAIMLGVFGIAIGYGFAALLRLHPRNARTVALETGIQNGPLAIAIIAFTFSGSEAQSVMAVPALYSLFIVGVRQAKPRTTEKKDNGPCL
jgi:BASS family bile acid:Na+ symporter